jgi:hypothetical protein
MHDIGATGYDKTIRRVWRYQGGNQNAYIEEHNGLKKKWNLHTIHATHCINCNAYAYIFFFRYSNGWRFCKAI